MSEEITDRESALISVAGNAVEERGLVADVLCARCSHGTVYRRRGRLDVVAYCSVMKSRVPTDIAECTDFSDPRATPLHAMQEIALSVDARVGVSDGAYA